MIAGHDFDEDKIKRRSCSCAVLLGVLISVLLFWGLIAWLVVKVLL